MNKLDKEYCLISDDDGHWYVVCVDDLEAFDNVIDSGGEEFYNLDVTPLNGSPSRVAFKQWREV